MNEAQNHGIFAEMKTAARLSRLFPAMRAYDHAHRFDSTCFFLAKNKKILQNFLNLSHVAQFNDFFHRCVEYVSSINSRLA